jgi:cell division septation protein DedD
VPLPTGATAKGAYGIQLGAFSSETGATAQWRTLTTKYASQLQGLQQHVVPADTASGRIYRLQATVGTEDRARAICVQLRTYGQACVAVLPH